MGTLKPDTETLVWVWFPRGAGPQIPINGLFSFRSPIPGPSPGKMGKYRIRVATGDSLLAGSSNLVQLWLVGEHGEKDLGKILRPIRIRVSGDGGDSGGGGGAHMAGVGGGTLGPRQRGTPGHLGKEVGHGWGAR